MLFDASMRILTLNANLRGVGTYQRCFYFSRELARYGHDVTMMTVSSSSRYRPKSYYRRGWIDSAATPDGDGPWIRMIEGANLGYRWLPGWGSAPIDIARRIYELNLGRYDVVYGFEYQPCVSWPVYLTHHQRGFRFFSDWCDWHAGHSNTFRGIEVAQRLDAFLEERIRFAAEHVTTISRCLAERASSIGLSRDSIQQIRQGVDLEYIQVHPKDQARRALGLSLDRPTLVWVKDAGEDYVLRMLRATRAALPEVQLLAVGNIGDGARRLAAELGVDDAVHWAGRVSDEDYPLWLAAGDAIVLPLDDELGNYARFPGKVLDYLAAARPVLTHDVGEVGELFRGDDIGVLAGASADELAAAAVELLSDGARCAALGREARRVMEESWDWRLRGPLIDSVVAR